MRLTFIPLRKLEMDTYARSKHTLKVQIKFRTGEYSLFMLLRAWICLFYVRDGMSRKRLASDGTSISECNKRVCHSELRVQE